MNTGMALGSKIYPCQAHIFPDFRVEIVMMIKWLEGCVVTKKIALSSDDGLPYFRYAIIASPISALSGMLKGFPVLY